MGRAALAKPIRHVDIKRFKKIAQMNMKRSNKMNKKKMTFARIAISFALALILCLGMATPAFATVNPNLPVNDKAALTKILKMPEGTQTPATKFQFRVTPVSVDDLLYSQYSGATYGQPGYIPRVSGDSDILKLEFLASYAGTVASGTKTVTSSSTIFLPASPGRMPAYTFTPSKKRRRRILRLRELSPTPQPSMN